jgi:hypothetical protein
MWLHDGEFNLIWRPLHEDLLADDWELYVGKVPPL